MEDFEKLGAFYLGRPYDLEKKQAALEEGEEIELMPVKFDDAIEMIKDGQILDGKTIATLLMFEKCVFHVPVLVPCSPLTSTVGVV